MLQVRTCIGYGLSFFRLLWNISLRSSTFRQNAKEVDTGRPSGHFGRGLGAIRALWSAWQCFFFPAGVDKSVSRAFYVRPNFILIPGTYIRAIFFFLLSSTHPEPRQHIIASIIQRACLPPPDYKTTAPPPSSSSSSCCSWQHHARMTGPRCALARWFCRSLRSITRPHHHHLSLPLLAVWWYIIYNTTLLSM